MAPKTRRPRSPLRAGSSANTAPSSSNAASVQVGMTRRGGESGGAGRGSGGCAASADVSLASTSSLTGLLDALGSNAPDDPKASLQPQLSKGARGGERSSSGGKASRAVRASSCSEARASLDGISCAHTGELASAPAWAAITRRVQAEESAREAAVSDLAAHVQQLMTSINTRFESVERLATQSAGGSSSSSGPYATAADLEAVRFQQEETMREVAARCEDIMRAQAAMSRDYEESFRAVSNSVTLQSGQVRTVTADFTAMGQQLSARLGRVEDNYRKLDDTVSGLLQDFSLVLHARGADSFHDSVPTDDVSSLMDFALTMDPDASVVVAAPQHVSRTASSPPAPRAASPPQRMPPGQGERDMLSLAAAKRAASPVRVREGPAASQSQDRLANGFLHQAAYAAGAPGRSQSFTQLPAGAWSGVGPVALPGQQRQPSPVGLVSPGRHMAASYSQTFSTSNGPASSSRGINLAAPPPHAGALHSAPHGVTTPPSRGAGRLVNERAVAAGVASSSRPGGSANVAVGCAPWASSLISSASGSSPPTPPPGVPPPQSLFSIGSGILSNDRITQVSQSSLGQQLVTQTS